MYRSKCSKAMFKNFGAFHHIIPYRLDPSREHRTRPKSVGMQLYFHHHWNLLCSIYKYDKINPVKIPFLFATQGTAFITVPDSMIT